MCEDDRKKVDSIVNKVFQMQWGKSTILSNLKDTYYVPAERFSNTQEVLPLTRLNTEDWTNLVKKGILHYGKKIRSESNLNKRRKHKFQNIIAICTKESNGFKIHCSTCYIFPGREGQTLDLLILPELLSMTSSLARCLTQPGGCALLAGRSGVGRHSSLRIISALQSVKLITPMCETISQFKLDLKSVSRI